MIIFPQFTTSEMTKFCTITADSILFKYKQIFDINVIKYHNLLLESLFPDINIIHKLTGPLLITIVTVIHYNL